MTPTAARAMDLEVYALPSHFLTSSGEDPRGKRPVCIVLDVVRATSTIIRLFERGASRVLVARDLGSARRLVAQEPRRFVDCAENDAGLRAEGFSYSTSPSELEHARVEGREVVFCTVNGTGCVHAAVLAGAQAVLLGGFRNAAAVAERATALALSTGGAPIAIVESGRHGNRTTALDDACCAGYIARLVWDRLGAAGREPVVSDSVRVAEAVYRAYPSPLDGLRDSGSGRGLIALGSPAADLEICAAVDATVIVPEVPLGSRRPAHVVDLILEPLATADAKGVTR